MRAKKFITKALHVVIVMICLATESTPNEQPPHAQSTTSSDLSKDLESGDIPFDKRIESMMFLTNGLILTEAIASKKLDMNRVITDFMIIGQLDDLVDWFEVLSSAEVDDETTKNIEGLFNQLPELHKVIENGFQSKINTEVLRTAASVMDRIGVINKVVEDALNYRELMKKTTSRTRFESVLKSLLRLPDTMKSFEKVSDRPTALNHVKNGIEILIKMNEKNVTENWEKAFSFCQVTGNKLEKENCGTSLRNAMTDLKIPVGENLSLLLDAIAVVDMLGMETSEAKWEKLEDIVDVLNSITDQLESIEKFRVNKEQALTNIRSFRLLMTEVQKLNASSDELQSVKFALTVLEPIQKIVEKLRKTYRSTVFSNSGTPKDSFVSFLKSYEGLPNGMKSIEALSERIEPSHGIPTQILKSKIAQRIEIMKIWITNISPMIGSRDAFKNIPRLLEFMPILMNTTTIGNAHELAEISSSVENYYDEIKTTGNILTTIKNLRNMITTFNSNNWKTNFVDIVNNYTAGVEKEDFEKLSKAFRVLPGFIEFTSKLKPLLTYEPDGNNYEADVRNFIEKHSHEVKDGIKIARKFLKVIENSQYTDSDISKIQKNFKIESRQIKLKLEAHNYTFDEVQQDLLGSDKFFLNENNKPTIESFVSTSTELLNSIIPNYDGTNAASMVMEKDDIDAVENLIKALVASRFKATVIEQSDAISKMMTNSPSGYHLLNSIRPGAMSYQKFADGYSAFMNIEGMSRRKRNAETSTLLDAVRKIFEKIKPITPINKNDASVSGILRDFPSFISPLKQFATDVKKISSDDQMEAQKSLEALKATGTTSDIMNIELEKIRQLLKVLGTKFSDQIFELISGLQKMYSILEFVDCQKTPNDPVCSIKGNTYWSTVVPKESFRDMVIISLVVVGVFAIVAGVIYWYRKKLIYWYWKKPIDKNAKNIEDIEANYQNKILENQNLLNAEKVRNHKNEKTIEELKNAKDKHEKESNLKVESWKNKYQKADKITKKEARKRARQLEEFENSITITTFTSSRIYIMFEFTGQFEEQMTSYNVYLYDLYNAIMAPEKKQLAEFRTSFMRVNRTLLEENCVTLKGDTNGRRVHANEILGMPGMVTYYASQAPRSRGAKKESCDSFFEMLFEKSITLVVQLCGNREEDQEVIDYTSTGTFGDYVVSKGKSGNTCEFVSGVKYEVVNKKTNTKFVFTHVILYDWEEEDAVGAPSDPRCCVDFIEVMIKKKTGAVLVHCQDGGERTMTFLNIVHIILNVMTYTTEVGNINILTAIAYMNNQRCNAVLSPIQLGFIQLALHYYYKKMGICMQNVVTYIAHLKLYQACQVDITAGYKKLLRKLEEKKIRRNKN